MAMTGDNDGSETRTGINRPRGLAAVDGGAPPTARTPHPLWPSVKVRPDTVTVYRLGGRSGAAELVLAEVPADDLDGGTADLSRAILRGMVGPGTFRLDPHRAGGTRGFAGPTVTVVLTADDGSVPGARGASSSGQRDPMDASLTVTLVRELLARGREDARAQDERASSQAQYVAQVSAQAVNGMMGSFGTMLTSVLAQTNGGGGGSSATVELLRAMLSQRDGEVVELRAEVRRLTERLHTAQLDEIRSAKGSAFDLAIEQFLPKVVERFLVAPPTAPSLPAPSTGSSTPSTGSSTPSTGSSTPSTGSSTRTVARAVAELDLSKIPFPAPEDINVSEVAAALSREPHPDPQDLVVFGAALRAGKLPPEAVPVVTLAMRAHGAMELP